MSQENQIYQIPADVSVEVQNDEITGHELDQLKQLGVARTDRTNYELERIELDLNTLREIAFEYSILEDIANSVEVEVMRHIRKSSNDRFTTGEIVEAVDRPPSTVSRTLKKLVEKGQISKVQNGVYERP